MRFAGRCVVNLHDRLSSMVPRVQENLPGLGKHYVVYEEIKPTMVEPIEMNLTTVKAELGSGDILVFQNELAAGVQRETLELPDVIAYFNFVMNRIRVEFRAIDKYKEPGFEIDLGTNMSYTVWTEKCAAHLNADPAYMRFTGHMTTTEGPRENPIRLSESPTLSVAAGHYVSVHTVHRQSAAVRRIIYYEILPSPLAEMETKTSLTVIHVDASLMEKARIKVVVPQNGKFADVLEELEKTIKKSEGGTGQLRVLLVQNYSIRTEMKPEDSVGSSYTYSYLQIQVEEVPQEELDMEEGDKRVEVRHFAKDIYRLHGRPFYQVIKQGETVGSVKERLRKRLNVSEKEWTKYKLARVVYASATYLEDDEEVLIREGIKCDVLGIDHADKSRTYKSSYERPLMIHN